MSEKKKIAFLFGAGCEGEGQLNLPSGVNFKKEIILSENSRHLYKKINPHKNDYDFSDGMIINGRSSKILFQTLKENSYLLNKYSNIKEIYEHYEEYLNQKHNKKEIVDYKTDFRFLYKDLLDIVKNKNKEYSKYDDIINNLTLCSYSDELFNYLRLPEIYKKEVSQVLKLYYSAYASIVLKLINTSNLDDINRNNFIDSLINAHRIFIDQANKKNLYYSIIKEIYERNKNKIYIPQIITTNYTFFTELITGWKENIHHIHGSLDLFEDIYTKRVGLLNSFSDSDVIFPFIFIPSGIKPIVSTHQIKTFSKAVNAIDESEILFVLGYGINTDDEHIINFLRDRLYSQKKIIWFLYQNKSEEKINKAFKNNLRFLEILSFNTSEELKNILEEKIL